MKKTTKFTINASGNATINLKKIVMSPKGDFHDSNKLHGHNFFWGYDEV